MPIPKLTKHEIDHCTLSDLVAWTFTADDALEGKEHRVPEAVALGLVRRTRSGKVVPTRLYDYLTKGE